MRHLVFQSIWVFKSNSYRVRLSYVTREYGHFLFKTKKMERLIILMHIAKLLEEIKEFIDVQIMGINSTSSVVGLS